MPSRDSGFIRCSIREKLLYLGIATFFLWPIVQLWSLQALPLGESDAHQQAAQALRNLLEEALARPFEALSRPEPFRPLPGYEAHGFEGRVEITPVRQRPGLSLVRAELRWGAFPLRKTLVMETLRTQVKP